AIPQREPYELSPRTPRASPRDRREQLGHTAGGPQVLRRQRARLDQLNQRPWTREQPIPRGDHPRRVERHRLGARELAERVGRQLERRRPELGRKQIELLERRTERPGVAFGKRVEDLCSELDALALDRPGCTEVEDRQSP